MRDRITTDALPNCALFPFTLRMDGASLKSKRSAFLGPTFRYIL
ncbi:hypothetical protein [Zobellia galactanivorans]|nr:hypothetical protein [Zobellia galactanivorans]